MKVLIVDDTPSNLLLLRAVLEAENFQVVEAADGVQALAALEKEPMDAIISDILMPRMDGYRFCHEVRKDARWQALPFVFYTSTYTSPGDEKLCYDLGGDKYLQKPAPANMILTALQEAVAGAARSQSKRVSSHTESDVMREYSERLVSKLEAKNLELERARGELHQINLELDLRVRQRTQELEASNLGLEAFSYSVSHDLRAPLRHIGGYAGMILKNGAAQLDETNLRHLHRIQEAVGKMEDIIEALLELTRVTHADFHGCEVDLSALAREVCEELQESASGREVQLDIAPGLTAQGDHRLLRVALVNLLGNALKFTSKRAKAHIQFGRMESQADRPYFVRDNGAGFDMAYATKLFGAFQRLHRRADYEGSGIGLATVQRIIHRHNGKTWAEGALDRGATFYFTLPDSTAKDDNNNIPPKKEAI